MEQNKQEDSEQIPKKEKIEVFLHNKQIKSGYSIGVTLRGMKYSQSELKRLAEVLLEYVNQNSPS